MTDPASLVVILLAIPAIIVSLLSQVELWQRKEYRLDRMLAALRGPELRSRLYPYLFALLAALVQQPAAAIVILLAYHSIHIFRRGLARPHRTTKALLL